MLTYEASFLETGQVVVVPHASETEYRWWSESVSSEYLNPFAQANATQPPVVL